MSEKEFRIVVVASKFKPERPEETYSLLVAGAIRLLDVLHHEDPDRKRFKLIHNGVTHGPLGQLFQAVNVLENGMRGRGYYFQRELHKMDILLHGKDTERLWLEDNAKDADAILVIDDGKIRADVRRTLEDLDVYSLEIPVEGNRPRMFKGEV